MKQVMESSEKSWQNGGSLIVDPTGEVVAGPLVDEEGILYADIEPMLAIKERQKFDSKYLTNWVVNISHF